MRDHTVHRRPAAAIGLSGHNAESAAPDSPSTVVMPPLDAGAFRQLLADVLEVGGRLWINGTGYSMTPTVREGDRVLLQRVGRALRTGDLVLVERGTHFVLHRVMRIDGDAVELRGDGLRGAYERVPKGSVLALAVAVRRNGRLRSTSVSLQFGWSALLRHGLDELRRHGYRLQLLIRSARPAVG